MANKLHTKVAYPFTKSNRSRDKIMSEVMMSRLSFYGLGAYENIMLSRDGDGVPKEILIHGYYFQLERLFALNAKAFYIYVEQDIYQTDGGKKFPELLQVMADPDGIYEDHECIFDTKASDDTEEAADLRDKLGLELNDGQLTRDGVPVDEFGGNSGSDGSSESDFVDLNDIFTVYYFGTTFDNSKKGKIWIRIATHDDGTIDVLNPYVYNEKIRPNQFGYGYWAPLGAVYKDFQDDVYQN